MITEQTWRETVAALLKHIDKETCTHDETHREGAIWETCSQCGATWADDKGGKPEFKWPEAVEAARALMAVPPDTPALYTAFTHTGKRPDSRITALPRYSHETADGVRSKILAVARSEGFKGTIDARLKELGWWVAPVYSKEKS